MEYRLGSFNTMKMGRNTSGEKINAIANIIINENMHIVALQEVFGEYVLESIRNRLGKSWESAYETVGNDKEGYAFLWNSKYVCCPSINVNGEERIFRPRILKQYQKFGGIHLLRNPFFGRFTPAGAMGGCYFEFRLINAHLRFSDTNSEEEQEYDFSATEKRQQEFQILTRAVYSKYEDKIYGVADENEYVDGVNKGKSYSSFGSMPSYTILLGDYNLNIFDNNSNPSPYLSNDAGHGEVIEVPSVYHPKRLQTFQKEKTTLKKESESVIGNIDIYKSNYDHCTYNTLRLDEHAFVSCKRIDVINKYYAGNKSKYNNEVSDHVPILITFEIKH